MHEVIPGILEKSFEEIEKKLEIIKPFSRRVHIDFLDGKFSPETSFLDPSFFSKYKDDFFMEAHLMVEDPLTLLPSLYEAGFKRFLGHIEKMKNIEEYVARGELLGEVGIAIDIDTDLDSIALPFDDLDSILLMSVKAGKSGQEFRPQVLEKIKSLKEKTDLPIELDGGINDKTITDALSAGAERFVATSFIFDSNDPTEAYEKLL